VDEGCLPTPQPLRQFRLIGPGASLEHSLGFKTCAADSGRHGFCCTLACYYILQSGTRIAYSNVAAEHSQTARSLVRSRSYCGLVRPDAGLAGIVLPTSPAAHSLAP
jgi:hypothetical protein